MQDRPIIALIGRPNVGKSTIFNRLIGRREAITSHISGTTRDRHFGVMQWYQNSWTVIDTAGILFEDENALEHKALQEAMEEQVALAVEEATVIAFVTDVKEGINAGDEKIIQLLRKQNKPVVILANKADNAQFRIDAELFSKFGIDPVIPVSGIHGSGIRDFVDYMMEHFPAPLEEAMPHMPRVTIIGRPNVGKSTLINQILGEERMVVSNIPGTTRDSITTEITLDDGSKFLFIDTAGIRRKGQIKPGIEKFSLFRTIRAINWSDIVILVLTIEEDPTRNDAHVAMYALEAKKQIILALNKADMAQESIFKLPNHKREALGMRFLRRFVFLQRLPFTFISAQTGEGMKDLLTLIKRFVNASEMREAIIAKPKKQPLEELEEDTTLEIAADDSAIALKEPELNEETERLES